jgi:hypothetical protein
MFFFIFWYIFLIFMKVFSKNINKNIKFNNRFLFIFNETKKEQQAPFLELVVSSEIFLFNCQVNLTPFVVVD